MRLWLIGWVIGVVLWSTWSTPVFAQAIADRASLAPILSHLDPRGGERPLACDVEPVKPSLSFGFRFRAGYVFRVPLTQYSGARHRWSVLTEIAPEGSTQPVDLLDVLVLPAILNNKMSGEAGGGYLLGEGRYRVKWILLDDLGRVCRKEWQIEVKLSRADSSAKVAMAPNSVAELSLRGMASVKRHPDEGRPLRLTVLVDAAPLMQRRQAKTVLSANDHVFLINVLSALLERVPTSSVRVVVFNLEQQKELFRRDGFTLESLDDMSRAMNELKLATVDYRILQNKTGHVAFVANLINRELRAAPPSDAAIFLGPRERFQDKVPAEAFDQERGPTPQFFFFRYRPFPSPLRQSPLGRPDPCDPLEIGTDSGESPRGRGRNNPCPVAPGSFTDTTGTFSNDTISLAVKSLKGKAIAIQSPGEFAKAIEQVERLVGAIGPGR
jgi:hypothetical protein